VVLRDLHDLRLPTWPRVLVLYYVVKINEIIITA
jgi:hypothetical protein